MGVPEAAGSMATRGLLQVRSWRKQTSTSPGIAQFGRIVLCKGDGTHKTLGKRRWMHWSG